MMLFEAGTSHVTLEVIEHVRADPFAVLRFTLPNALAPCTALNVAGGFGSTVMADPPPPPPGVKMTVIGTAVPVVGVRVMVPVHAWVEQPEVVPIPTTKVNAVPLAGAVPEVGLPWIV